MIFRTRSQLRLLTSEITLVHIDSPAIVQDDRTITLPVHSWLSAGFWDLFGLPAVDRALTAVEFGTECTPRTYVARHRNRPATWTEEPLSVEVPTTIGPGPGVLEISGPMTSARRRLVERTAVVIALATPAGHRPDSFLPESMWEEGRWHTAVLVPGPPAPAVRRTRWWQTDARPVRR